MRDDVRSNIVRFRCLIFFIVSAIVLLFASRCSFFYPMDDMPDANCFFSSARYMLSGKVLYSDFFEQKGPVVYFLHMLALLIAPNSYHGIYVIEVICATLYCYFMHKTISLFSPFSDTKNILITVIACMSSYATGYMSHGDEIEEFALPIFAHLIYHILRYIVKKEDIPRHSLFLGGILAGLIFWSKFTIVAAYGIVAIYCAIIAVKRKDHKNLKNICLFALLGFAVVTLAMMIYFFATGSFSDMIDVYFKENIFGYRSDMQLHENKIMSIVLCFGINIGCMKFGILYFAMFLIMLFSDFGKTLTGTMKDTFRFLVYSYWAMWFAISLHGTAWGYYYMHHSVYFALILTMFLHMIQSKNIKHVFILVNSVLAAAGCVFLILDMNLQKYNRDQKVYKDVAEIVGDHSLIMANDLDTGFYFAANNWPDEYYFTVTNARNDIIISRIGNMVSDGLVDYVVVMVNDPSQNMDVIFKQYDYEACYSNVISPEDKQLRLYKRSGV